MIYFLTTGLNIIAKVLSICYSWVHNFFNFYLLNSTLDTLTQQGDDHGLVVGLNQETDLRFQWFSVVRRGINILSEEKSITCNNVKRTNRLNYHGDKFKGTRVTPCSIFFFP